MVAVKHANLAAGRWFQLSLLEQLGNLGSEVSRAIAWQQKGESFHRENALQRAFELLDLTIVDPRWQKRLKEIVRLREVLVDVFYGNNVYQTSFEDLEKYFYYFAAASRNQRDHKIKKIIK